MMWLGRVVPRGVLLFGTFVSLWVGANVLAGLALDLVRP